jgi:hypothetical protein
MSSSAPRLLLACTLLACGPAGAQQGAPVDPGARVPPYGPAAPAVPSRPRLFDEAVLQSIYTEAVAALRDGAQVELREPVPALLLTAAEARERRAAFSRSLPENAGTTAAIDLAADFMFSDSMLGRYLPDEKVLYIIEEVLEADAGGDLDRAREQLFGVMAHELVHAHDDQVYGVLPSPAVLLEVAADGRRLGEIQALMTLLEGHATYAAELASLHTGRKPLRAISLEEARRADVVPTGGDSLERLGSGLLNTLARTKLVQYAHGREFCRAAYRFGGEKFLGEVFRHLPLSVQEVEDFERFKQRWAREVEEAEEAEEAEDAAAPSGV